MQKYLLFIFIILILAGCISPPQVAEPTVSVVEPIFEIVSIAIIQAELINTQFETVLKIINPNSFPVELTSLKYELHGNGMFWADGIENNVLVVPANNSVETKFRFSMNFINMNRRLLDDVIAMRQVQYRFRGNAQVRASIPRAPVFSMNYDISGLSEVKPKAE
jgi:LEA14-like dessication related protein